jgi:hypothetical protein
MGGPWRDRRFDAAAWRTPVARVEGRAEVVEGGGRDQLIGIVIGYIASVLTSVAVMLTVLHKGW